MALWNFIVRRVRDGEQQVALLFLRGGRGGLDRFHFRTEFFRFVFQRGAVFFFRPECADVLAQTFAFGLQMLPACLVGPALGIDREDLVDHGFVARAAEREERLHGFGGFAEAADIKHGRTSVARPRASAKRRNLLVSRGGGNL